jgi:hypothetical protein
MEKTTVEPLSTRVVAVPSSTPLTTVTKFLKKYGEKRPIPVEEMLPVTLMNYGQLEFEEAQFWSQDRFAISTTEAKRQEWRE